MSDLMDTHTHTYTHGKIEKGCTEEIKGTEALCIHYMPRHPCQTFPNTE